MAIDAAVGGINALAFSHQRFVRGDRGRRFFFSRAKCRTGKTTSPIHAVRNVRKKPTKMRLKFVTSRSSTSLEYAASRRTSLGAQQGRPGLRAWPTRQQQEHRSKERYMPEGHQNAGERTDA